MQLTEERRGNAEVEDLRREARIHAHGGGRGQSSGGVGRGGARGLDGLGGEKGRRLDEDGHDGAIVQPHAVMLILAQQNA